MRYIQGMPVQGVSLRTPSESDAGAMIELLKCCYGETEYLTRTPEEFQITLQYEIEYLRRQERDERSCMIWRLQKVGSLETSTSRPSAMRDASAIVRRWASACKRTSGAGASAAC